MKNKYIILYIILMKATSIFILMFREHIRKQKIQIINYLIFRTVRKIRIMLYVDDKI